MATVYDHFAPVLKVIDYAHQRQREIDASIEDLKKEAVMWNEIIAKYEPCPTCNGHGELRHILSQDESDYETCSSCGGKGSKS